MEPKAIIERIDEIVSPASDAPPLAALTQLRDTIASDAGLCCCYGCGEWVSMAEIGESDMCRACMEGLIDEQEARRDDAESAAADARLEAAKINRNLWSLGGGRAPLLLLAAWPVVEVMGR